MFSKSKEETLLIIIGTALFILLIAVIILLFIIFQNKKNKLIQEREVANIQFQQTIIQTQIEIQEQTLKTISQEIHDNIGQILSLTKLTLGSIQLTDTELANKINTTKTLVNKAIIDLKDISNSLNTDSIEAMGIIQAVQNEIDLINKTNIAATFEIIGKAVRLNPKTELILFRMVQECLNNAIKHAQAKKITVTATYTTNNFDLIIADDGIGFNIEKTNNKGLGLKNMQSRVRFIHATLNVASNYEGTTININVPC